MFNELWMGESDSDSTGLDSLSKATTYTIFLTYCRNAKGAMACIIADFILLAKKM